jgi:hypothetical protein
MKAVKEEERAHMALTITNPCHTPGGSFLVLAIPRQIALPHCTKVSEPDTGGEVVFDARNR